MLTIDQNKCIGCGTCVVMDPKTFELNQSTGKSQIRGDSPEPDNSKLKEIAESCPVSAIKLQKNS